MAGSRQSDLPPYRDGDSNSESKFQRNQVGQNERRHASADRTQRHEVSGGNSVFLQTVIQPFWDAAATLVPYATPIIVADLVHRRAIEKGRWFVT
jgi:hypothetical protein